MTLTFSGLTKRYGEFSFGPLEAAIANEVFCVLGPSGSGKSTLLALLAGITEPDDGEVLIDGRSMRGRRPEARETGLVFQDGALFPHLTARENIEYAATDSGYVDELTGLLDIEGVLDRRPAKLSGGERQRVALARTLASGPAVLLLDEPLSSLDEPIRRRLRGELHELFDTLDVPVVYVTHDQRTATALADRMAILRNGRFEQVASPTTVLERPNSRFVAEFTGNENVFEVDVGGSERDGTARVDAASFRVPAGTDVNSLLDTTEDSFPTTVCVHPSRIELARGSDAVENDLQLPVTVERWLHENDTFRVFTRVEDGPRIVVTMSRSAFDRLDPARGEGCIALLPPASIHALDGSRG